MKSAQPWNDDELQQAFDGAGESQTIEALKASEEGQVRLHKLAHLRRHLQEQAAVESPLSPSESNALFERVQTELASVDTVAMEDVAEGDVTKRPALELVSPQMPQAAPMVEVVQEIEFWKRALPAAGLLAVAAALVLVYLAPSGPQGRRGLAELDGNEPELIMIADHAGSEVVEADFGDNIGTIFEVEGNAGEPIVVVWISDEQLGADDEAKEVLQ